MTEGNLKSAPEEASTENDAQAIAERSAQTMWSRDKASQTLGMELTAIGPGSAMITMTVTDSMVNGHDIGHGGYTFALADSAFAFACNSYKDDAVALHCDIVFSAPTRLGDTLTARAVERWRRGRSGLYDVTVTNQAGETVAEFRGLCRTVKPVDPGAATASTANGSA
jgi:acyl-CoA thioesterase